MGQDKSLGLSHKKKRMDKKVKDIEDTKKRSNICKIRVIEEEQREDQAEAYQKNV